MKACSQCPWRLSNQGKPHPNGFYTKRNLTRLWNQIRNGGQRQSCHMTDPSHPDHIEAGCKTDSEARECPGSVLLVLREVNSMANEDNHISAEEVRDYLKRRRKGLTRQGILWWMIQRIQMGGVPLLGGPKLPEVDEDAGVGLPTWMHPEGER